MDEGSSPERSFRKHLASLKKSSLPIRNSSLADRVEKRLPWQE